MNIRDAHILTHMIAYCDQIDEAVNHFGRDQETFFSDKVYQNAVALCLLQIGE